MKTPLAAAVFLAVVGVSLGQGFDVLEGLGKDQPRFAAAGKYVSIQAIPSHWQVIPGEKFYVAVVITIADGWVFYSPEPLGSDIFTPIPASISVSANSITLGAILWPADHPHETDFGEGKKVTTMVYTGKAVAYAELIVPNDAPPGPRNISVTLEGQICSEKAFTCLSLRRQAETTVTVGPSAVTDPRWGADIAAGLSLARPADRLHGGPGMEAGGMEGPTGLTVWTGLGTALLAGLILNIMPCVLPVLPIRVLSVVELARQSRRRFVTVGLAYAGGILLFFVALAAVNAAFELAVGRGLEWGRQFQSVPFRIVMAMLMVAVAANLFGVFTVNPPRRLAAIEGRSTPRTQGHLSSLGMGLMTAILATPCSFAILVLALAWARIQPLWLGTAAIAAIGVGMAAPHALLTAAPRLLALLPRPGRWMELLRHAMGFALLLVAAWLISTLGETGVPIRAAAFGVVLAAGLWIWGTVVRFDWPAGQKLCVRTAAVLLVIAGGPVLFRPARPPAVAFAPFSEPAIASANNNGQIVLVDFTAEWCLSCKIVDATIYDNPSVAKELKSRNVLAMRGDVTNADSPANHLLYDVLKGAPPLTVIYPPAGRPIRLEGKFSKAELMAALEKAKK